MNFSRRNLLIAAAALGSGLGRPRSTLAAPVCVLQREQLRGPYYIDDERVRRDIAEGLSGLSTTIRIRLIDSRSCKPLAGAAIDVWQCDSAGVYSGFRSYDPDKPPVGIVEGRLPQTDQQTYLRGVQFTNRHGEVEFKTIFPGWYYGRAPHFHLKVHVDAPVGKVMQPGRVCYTGQLFYPEDLAAVVGELEPYSLHKLARTSQSKDFVYTSSDGAANQLDFSSTPRSPKLRHAAGSITLEIDPAATTNPPRGPSQGGVGPTGP